MSLNIIFDIETIPNDPETILASLPPFDPDKVKLGNASKPETIERIIEEARKSYGQDVLESAALDPRYSTVAIAGLLYNRTVADPLIAQPSQATMTEAEILQNLWERIINFIGVDDGKLVIGFHVKWDLRFCVIRSWILGIPVPPLIFDPLSRFPFANRVLDLQDVLAAGDYGKAHESLASWLNVLGLPAKTGKGSEFPAMWKRNQQEALDYNKNDLFAERALAARVGVL